MLSIDLIIVAAYAAALMITKKREYSSCLLFFVITVIFATALKSIFSVRNGGIECLYYLTLSAIWLLLACKIENNKVRIAVMVMTTYELLCGIESFIWQFILPVTTPVIEYYIENVIAIHVIILISIYRWGVKIEKPVERIFIDGKRFCFSVFSNKILARDHKESKR